MRTLIVDDNLVNRHILQGHLSFFGECETAKSGKEALELFIKARDTQQPFNLICLDIGMPGMDGHETLENIRKLEAEQQVGLEDQVKVLMVSAFSDRENVLRAYRLCQGYVKKPINKEILFEKLAILGFFPKHQHKKDTDLTQTEEQQGSSTIKPALDENIPDDVLNKLPLLNITDDRLTVSINNTDKNTSQDVSYQETEPDQIQFWQGVKKQAYVARLGEHGDQIILGTGIKRRKNHDVIYASKSGRVVIDDNTIFIDDVLTIEGLVAHRHIDFPGKIIINGDVKDGVQITGDVELTINGNVGECFLFSAGAICFSRIYGRQRAVVKGKKHLKADCIYESQVEVNGKLLIHQECINSDLKSGDTIKCNGTITGGDIMALNCIEVKRLGSPKDVTTRCLLGNDFRLLNSKLEKELMIEDIEKRLSQVKIMLGPYAEDLGKAMLLPEEKKKKIYEYAEMFNELKEEQTAIQTDVKQLESRIFFNPLAKLIVKDKLFKGVSIQIGDVKQFIDESLDGPIAITADQKKQELIIENL